MNQQSIVLIRQQYQHTNASDMANFIAQYQRDQRKGVQQLVARARRVLSAYSKRKEHLNALYQFDLSYCSSGCVVGVDEAGRGPLAGPVVAAACMIKPSDDLLGLDDSKKLSETDRERFFQIIIQQAISYGIGIVDNAVIDEINILNATKLAMQKALDNADKVYDIVLTDYVQLPYVKKPLYGIVKGDTKSLAIAAASVLAKVTRDRMLKDYDKIYPNYGFAKHKGYGTAFHIEQIKKHGSCTIHRQSFLKGI